MQKFSTSFKVGFVVLLGLVMTIVMLVRFSVNWGQNDGTYQLKAYFDDATGLAVRSKVMVAGIQVGEIESITLDNAKALVTFRVRKDIILYEGIPGQNFSKNGATVSKQISGILGDYHLELTTGIEGGTLQDGDFIPNVIKASGIDGVLSSAGDILKDVSQVTHNLSAVLGGENGEQKLVSLLTDLNETMKNVRAITDDNAVKIARIVDNIERITQNAAGISQLGQDEFPLLIARLDDILRQAQNTMQTVQSGVGNTFESTQGGIAQLRESIDKLDRTLSHIETIAKNVEQGEGTVGKLLTDDSIANEAQALLAETRTLIQQGTKTVESANDLISPLSDLAVDISLRGDYMVNANAFKVDFGVKLQPSFDKYYFLGLVMDPHGTTTTKTVLTDSSVDGPVYETITTNDDSVKFSLLYARRWRWFTGRFGIIENTGGLGGDVELFDDNLKFSFDLFAFNDNEYPRFRGLMMLYASLFFPGTWGKTFYLTAGFDDPGNKDIFDYFFGIGFRFTDNDIKSLMTIIPTP